MRGKSGSKASRAAGAAGDEVRRLASTPAVQRAVGRARTAARSTVNRLPGPRDDQLLRSTDFEGVATTGILIDPEQARAARRTARGLGLPRAGDGAAAWCALGALAALLRIGDDGRRRAVVVDTARGRSVFSRWAQHAGFLPVSMDVAAPDVVGDRLDAGSVDLVAMLHPNVIAPGDVDVEVARASAALRRGGLLVLSVQIGPVETGGVDVADLRALIARLGEQGMSLVGDLDLDEIARARAMRASHADRPAGLALLTLRRR